MKLLSATTTFSLCCFSLLIGCAYPAAAQSSMPPCSITNNTSPPMMTFVIINNSPQTIYPVLSAGDVAAEDNWMEACFGTTQAQITNGQVYPRGAIYRFYINPTTGIPAKGMPGSTVTVTLPIYSVLS